MVPAAVVDVVAAFLRLTFEFEEPREEEGKGETVPSDPNVATGIPYFDH